MFSTTTLKKSVLVTVMVALAVIGGWGNLAMAKEITCTAPLIKMCGCSKASGTCKDTCWCTCSCAKACDQALQDANLKVARLEGELKTCKNSSECTSQLKTYENDLIAAKAEVVELSTALATAKTDKTNVEKERDKVKADKVETDNALAKELEPKPWEVFVIPRFGIAGLDPDPTGHRMTDVLVDTGFRFLFRHTKVLRPSLGVGITLGALPNGHFIYGATVEFLARVVPVKWFFFQGIARGGYYLGWYPSDEQGLTTQGGFDIGIRFSERAALTIGVLYDRWYNHKSPLADEQGRWNVFYVPVGLVIGFDGPNEED